ncbi:hypothetical protein OUZ56_010645 [Daphnia magna]|uniref:Uncharacterized protein n=1 Tax=Daphnia magna TaxID=35525 RepID=A0ABR0AJ58_9CRUS|nr:hypothetical protein OUZ56_010645 [Daphnia magna]
MAEVCNVASIDIVNYKTKDRFLRYSSSSRTSRVYAVVRYCQLKVHNLYITLLVIHTIFKTWVSSCVISSNHPDLLWSANEKHLHISKFLKIFRGNIDPPCNCIQDEIGLGMVMLLTETIKLMFQLPVNVYVDVNGVGVAFLNVVLEIGVRFQMR